MEERMIGDYPRDCRPDVCCKETSGSTIDLIMYHAKARDVSIRQQDYGYVVSVGCQTFCIEKLQVVLDMLNNYLKNPQSLEDMWRKGELVIEANTTDDVDDSKQLKRSK